MFKAAILTELNKPITVDNIELPDTLGVGQVLVKILSSTICGAQIGEQTGAKGEDRFLPHLMGHEGCGIVLDVGSGVTTVAKNDKVVLHWRKGAGIEATPVKYKWCDRVVGAGPVHSFCQLAVVSENRLTAIRQDVSPEIGSLMGCAVTTALGLINNEAQLKIGQSIAIAGVGGVGLNIVQGAAMVGGNPIIAIDQISEKLGTARLLGATHQIHTIGELIWAKFKNKIESSIGNRLIDVFVDCTGNPTMIDFGYKITAPGGRMILVGQPKIDTAIVFTNARQHYNGKMIIDSQGGLTNPNVDIPRYVALYQRGKLELDSLVTDTFPLEKINEAFDLVKTGKAGRVALEMW